MNNSTKSEEQLSMELQELQRSYSALLAHSENQIAELTKTVESLQKSNEHFKATLNALPIIMFELDSVGRIFDFYAPHHEMLFVQPEMFLGKTIYETLPPDTWLIIEKAIDEAKITGLHKGSCYSLITPDGLKWYELAISRKIEHSSEELKYIVLVSDITKRKQAENESERTQKLLEDSQRIGKIGGWEFNIDTSELKWTKEMYNIHEVDSTFNLTVDQRINFYSPESLAAVDKAVQNAIEHGKSYEIESEIITAKGNQILIRAIGRADSENRRIIGFVQDITERKHIENALKESEEKFRSIFQNHSAVKLLIDPVDAKIVDANSAAAKYYGWTVSELTKMKISQLNIADPQEIKKNIQSVIDQHRTIFEARHRRADGSLRNVNINSGLVTINGKDYLHSIINDITEQKRSEEIIKNQAELLNLAHDSIIVRDLDSKITYWNKGAEIRYGWTTGEVMGKVIHELLKTIFPIPMEAILNELLHNAFWEGELIHTTKDGSILTVASRWQLQTDTENMPYSIFEINNDITAQKRAEAAIKMKNEELIRLNVEKDKFFSIISHDLRCPFNGFLGLTEIMANDIHQMTLDEIQNMSLLMQKSASNLYDLLGNLLEWSRLQRGLITIVPESLLLLPGIVESLRLIQETARNKEIQIDVNVPSDLMVHTDTNILDGIIRNLTNNAVKFTPRGGRIIVSAKSVSEISIEISIRDNGIGMNQQMVDNLFRLDFNTGRKGTEGESSTGMGLIICKDLIGKIGGELQVQSEVGKGSEFKFTIPKDYK